MYTAKLGTNVVFGMPLIVIRRWLIRSFGFLWLTSYIVTIVLLEQPKLNKC